MTFKLKWNDLNVKAKHPSNPEYPEGISIDASNGAAKTCKIKLPYPAKGCGQHIVTCNKCKQTAVITATGRKDDPTDIKLACKIFPNLH